jgi:hypothetical protein
MATSSPFMSMVDYLEIYNIEMYFVTGSWDDTELHLVKPYFGRREGAF